jgi:hypothetical protein
MYESESNFPTAIWIGPSASESYCERYSQRPCERNAPESGQFVYFVRGVSRHVSVDAGLSESKLRKTALSLRLSSDDVHLLQAPISGLGTSPTRQSIDIVDKRKLAQLAKALRNDEMDKYVETCPER